MATRLQEPNPPNRLVSALPWVGAVLTLLMIGAWLTVVERSLTSALAILAGLTTLVYAGKEAGLPVGIAAGAEPVAMGVFIFLADAAATCFLYPPLHHAIRRWMERPDWLGRYLRFVRDRGMERRSLVTRHGTYGLFLFMLIPFAINGPLFGAVLGRMMGLRAIQIVPTLMAAVFVTTVAWTTIYILGFSVAASIDQRLPKLVALCIIAFVLVNTLWSFYQMGRRQGGRPSDEDKDYPLEPPRTDDDAGGAALMAARQAEA